MDVAQRVDTILYREMSCFVYSRDLCCIEMFYSYFQNVYYNSLILFITYGFRYLTHSFTMSHFKFYNFVLCCLFYLYIRLL